MNDIQSIEQLRGAIHSLQLSDTVKANVSAAPAENSSILRPRRCRVCDIYFTENSYRSCIYHPER